MRDDVSAIDSAWCNVLTSPTSLSSYSGNTRKDFVFNGGKWYLYRTQYSNYNDYDTSNFSCLDVSNLNSNAVYEPIFHFIGFFVFCFWLVLAWFLVRNLFQRGRGGF